MTFDCLHVCLVGPLPPPAGGMANQTRQLAELLTVEGARVDIVQVNAPYSPAWAGRIKGLRAVFRLVPYLYRLWRAAGRADVMHVMANSGWSWHLYAMPAIRLAAMRRTPIVVNYRGGEAGTFLETAANSVRASMKRASSLILPSGFLLDVFARYGMVGRIVPNIIDVDRFSPAETSGKGEGGFSIIVTRNLEAIYGIDVVIKAFALVIEQLPDAHLAIAGSGPLCGALETLAKDLGIEKRVEFTGRLDRDQVAALYRDAHLSVNPSHVDNMPNSVLESMASGVPVISTRVGGVPFIVEDGQTALLVPPNDPVAMARAIVRVGQDSVLADRLRNAARDEVQRYRWAAVKHELLSAYEDAMRSPADDIVRPLRD
ncbi:MAG: glycosyltransferase family 4 protein [Rhodocyclaceae bacterium]|nr:glycosyltransferase family 4 protein [Rhodocyclaceae bacterium]